MSSIVLRPTDEHEVIEISAGPSNNKLPGYIDVPATLIKESKFVIARYLSNLFNQYITNGTFPDISKVAKIVALHKGGSKSELANYRPIILLPFRKCFERSCVNGLQITETTCSAIVNLAFEKIIRPILLPLICMKQSCKHVMTINWFVAFFFFFGFCDDNRLCQSSNFTRIIRTL